ncbi:MAG: hypothetical protein GY866_28870 [Proteobacteria bacterium]|nr:hypothetical protein [Pseudomonadota bacterium]
MYKVFNNAVLMAAFFGILFLSAEPSSASENDSYTHRFESLPDQTDYLNQLVNGFLEKAVDMANLQSEKIYFLKNDSADPKEGRDCCNPKILYLQIRFQLARPVVGQLESLIDDLPNEESRKISFEESIYRDFTFAETPTLSGVKKMGSLVRMQNFIVGADKFGHFFSEGWSYFSVAYTEGIHIEAALLFGEMSESVFFGALTTGVYSFADLAANFNGMRFWNNILGLHPDVLGTDEKPSPYILCENNRWQVVEKFDWRDYIDSAWDEGVNCSAFRNDTLLKKATSQIDLLSQAEKKDFRCSLERGKIDRLRNKYGRYSPHLLGPDHHAVLAEKLQPQPLLDKFWNSRKQDSKSKWQIKLFNLIEMRIKELQEKRGNPSS